MRRLLAFKRRRTRGSLLILTLMMVPIFLIPLVGLAIDGTMMYIVQAKLSAAADGAVLGAGRLLNTSANTTEIAGEFMNVNFPTNYWGSRNLQSSVTATDVSGLHTVTMTASVQVPTLFMRILGQQYATVSVNAQASKRDVRMMIVVDRSGSVVLEQANTSIVNVLQQFVATGTTFKDGTDEVGMISFGATWKLDFAPTLYFQSGSPNIGTAISNIPFTLTSGSTMNSGTNTAEGLYQAWYQLRQINDPSALNVILLLTDGRPSGFTGTFTSTHNCSSTSHPGVLQSTVGTWPPPNSNSNNILGMTNQQYVSNSYVETYYQTTTNPNGCTYLGGGATGSNDVNVPNDIPSFPSSAGPIDNVGSISTYTGSVATTTGYYNNFGNSTSSQKSVRYAAFNVADNIAKLIRQDTVIKPVMFVIGISYSVGGTEPLDSDWLARVANDQSYTVQTADSDAGTTVGESVYQSGQTTGQYVTAQCSTRPCNSSGLQSAFAKVASSILRLSQ